MTAFSIILLAMIAAFLGMRLYSVLGKRTGHEQEPVLPRRDDRAAPAPVRLDESDAVGSSRDQAPVNSGLVYEPSAEAGLRQLLASDRHFDAGRFMDGAQAAYRMILEAFWKGDRDTLRDLCDDDSYEGFIAAIEDREARGEKLENRLIGIDFGEDYRGRTRPQRSAHHRALSGGYQRGDARCRRQADRRIDERCGADRRSVDLPPQGRQQRSQLAARRS